MTAIFRGFGRVNMGGFVKIYPTPVSAGGPGPGPLSWVEYTEEEPNATLGQMFGSSVAISNDGNWVVAGTEGEGNDSVNNIDYFYGSFYLFNWNGTEWIQVAKLTSPDGDEQFASFGCAVAVNSDATRIAIGSDFGYGSTSDVGKVHIYSRSGSIVTHQETLTAAIGQSTAEFGSALSFDDSGNYLAVGSPGHSGGGRAYVFFWNGSAWVEQATITKPIPNGANYFGTSISIDSSGSKMVVGDSALLASPSSSGKALVYTRSGSVWSLLDTLSPSDGDPDDLFGYSVSMSKDGNYIAVGAMWQADGIEDKAGAVYVFFWNGSTWVEQAKLKASDSEDYLQFGAGVALTSDGSRLIVGGNDNYYASNKALYLFDRTLTTWSETEKFAYTNFGSDFREYGESVAISSNGLRLVTGVPETTVYSDGGPEGPGQIRIFHYE